MIYGRRLFDKSLEQPFRRKPVLRVFKVINSHYQWKYARYFNVFLLGSLLLFLGPCLYFVWQNYSLFSQIAQQTNPSLLAHLDREIAWMVGFAIFSMISLFVMTCWVTIKMTGQIIGPLISLERHMWKVAAGDWSTNDFKIRAEDDFRDLAETYSYLYRALKAQSESELKLLDRIIIDPHQKDSFNALTALKTLKAKQTNLQSRIETLPSVAEPPSEAPGLRRVS